VTFFADLEGKTGRLLAGGFGCRWKRGDRTPERATGKPFWSTCSAAGRGKRGGRKGPALPCAALLGFHGAMAVQKGGGGIRFRARGTSSVEEEGEGKKEWRQKRLFQRAVRKGGRRRHFLAEREGRGPNGFRPWKHTLFPYPEPKKRGGGRRGEGKRLGLRRPGKKKKKKKKKKVAASV